MDFCARDFHFFTAAEGEADAFAAKACSNLWKETCDGKQPAKKEEPIQSMAAPSRILPSQAFRFALQESARRWLVPAPGLFIRAPTKAKGAKQGEQQLDDSEASERPRGTCQSMDFTIRRTRRRKDVDNTMTAATSLILLCVDKEAKSLSQVI